MYFVFSVSHSEESGRYYSDLGEAIGSAVSNAVVLARATHSDAKMVVQTYQQEPHHLVWEVNAYKPRQARGIPAVNVVNLF